MKCGILCVFLYSVVSVSSAGTGAPKITLVGVGSSFAGPLIQQWKMELATRTAETLVVDYQPQGSGVGQAGIIAKDLDFGASDAPLSKKQREDAIYPLLHIPFTAGAVTIAYNIPGLDFELDLTADLFAQILQQDITWWNDSRLLELNPTLAFFPSQIKVVVRGDSSGTTFALTDYLTKTAPEWLGGRTTLPNWPNGLTQTVGNAVLGSTLRLQAFSIGYLELSVVDDNILRFARLRNRSGKFIGPSVEAVIEAQENTAQFLPTGLQSWDNVSLVDAPGNGSWPISTFSSFLVYQDQSAMGAKGAALVAFLKYALSQRGLPADGSLDYASIGNNIVVINTESIASIKYDTEWSPDLWLAYKESENDNTLIIVASAIGTVAGLALIIVLFALLYVIHSKLKKDLDHRAAHIETEMRRFTADSSMEDLKQLEDIKLREKIGQGKFGAVYLGQWMDSTKVALKTYNIDIDKEATILKSLNHPNIVQFFGIFKSPKGAHFIVMEYMNGGSLLELLRKMSTSAPMYQLLSMCMGACAGMMYLEKERIVHKDLACRNLLVSRNGNLFTVKVTDFGLATRGETTGESDSPELVPVRWSAPEVFESHAFSHLSDVWSFGVCMWEIFTFGQNPYPGIANADVIEYVKSGKTLEKPSNCPTMFYELWQSCWSLDLLARPTFYTLFKEIEKLESLQPRHLPTRDNAKTFYLAPEGESEMDIYVE